MRNPLRLRAFPSWNRSSSTSRSRTGGGLRDPAFRTASARSSKRPQGFGNWARITRPRDAIAGAEAFEELHRRGGADARHDGVECAFDSRSRTIWRSSSRVVLQHAGRPHDGDPERPSVLSRSRRRAHVDMLLRCGYPTYLLAPGARAPAMSLEQGVSAPDVGSRRPLRHQGTRAPEDVVLPPMSRSSIRHRRLLQPRRTALRPARWRKAHGDAVPRHRVHRRQTARSPTPRGELTGAAAGHVLRS